MSDESDRATPGASASSRALERATEKSLDGLGAFFGAICMPAAEEFGLLLRDRVAEFRKRNVQKIAEKTYRKLQQLDRETTGDASPVLVKMVIEEASWASDDVIQDMWAGLLAEASTRAAASDDSIIYTDILKRLTPFQARVINCVYYDPRCVSLSQPIGTQNSTAFYPENEIRYSVREILELFPGDLSDVVPIAHATHDKLLETESDHGIAIGTFRPQLEWLVTNGLLYDFDYGSSEQGGIRIIPTYKGMDFYLRCIGNYFYPIEACILSMQHQWKQRGKDPFSYRAT